MVRVKFVEPAGGYRLNLGFTDGSRGTVDLEPHLRGEIFDPLREPSFFAQATIGGGTVTWPNGADFAPEFLHALANGLAPPGTLQDAKTNERDVSLRTMRRQLAMRQEDVALAMGVTQGGLAQLEARDDKLLSTLHRYARAVGGRLEVTIVVGAKRFPVGGF